jgi:hypothetical protein
MLTDTDTAYQVSRVISEAIAPAFLLGAVAAFISLLITRMNRIVDRVNIMIARPESDAGGRAHESRFTPTEFALEIDEPCD